MPSPQQKDSVLTSQKTVCFCQEDQAVNVVKGDKGFVFLSLNGTRYDIRKVRLGSC